MNPFASLSPENEEQIRKYLRFFRQKKDATLRTINSEFDDAVQGRLNDDMYSKEDVLDFVDFLKSSIKNQVNTDFGTSINMSALAVSQLLGNAQDVGAELRLDTSAVENAMMLDAVERMSLDGMGRTPSKAIGKLSSLKDEAKVYREESERLESSNKALQERFTIAQERATSAQTETARLLRDKKGLLEELSSLQGKLDQLAHSSAGESKESAEINSKLSRLEEELEVANEENTKRVSETTQFQQMKKMMQSQSAKIRDLRRRLAKYEPEDADCKGDDA